MVLECPATAAAENPGSGGRDLGHRLAQGGGGRQPTRAQHESDVVALHAGQPGEGVGGLLGLVLGVTAGQPRARSHPQVPEPPGPQDHPSWRHRPRGCACRTLVSVKLGV